MARRKLIHTDGCVVKNGNRICKDPAAPGTNGLLCATGLRKWQNGQPVVFMARLTQGKRRILAKLRGPASPSKPKGTSNSLTGALFSLPSIFALAGTSMTLLLELAWARGMNISLPYGTGLATVSSAPLAHILMCLVLVVVAFLALLLISVIIGYIALVLRAAVVVLVGCGYGLLWILQTPVGYLGAHSYSFLSRVKQIKATGWYQNARTAQQQSKAKSISTFKSLPKSALDLHASLIRHFRRGAQALFATGPISWQTAAIRSCVMLVASISLFVLTKNQAAEMQAKVASLTADSPCIPITSVDTYMMSVLPFSLLATELPCGQVILSGEAVMDFSNLPTTASAENPPLSDKAVHLGRYGDWAVFAPLHASEERVFVKARQVVEFSQRIATLDDHPTTWTRFVSTKQRFINAITVTERVLRRAELNRWAQLVDRFEAAERLAASQRPNMPRILAAIKADQPWASDLETAAEQQLRLVDEIIVTLNELNPGDTLSPGQHALIWDTVSAVNVTLSSGLFTPTAEPRPLPRLSGLLDARLTQDQQAACASGNPGVSVQFSEGSHDVPPDQLKQIEEMLAKEGWSRTRSGDEFLVRIEGFASGTGAPHRNLELADLRADAVKRGLVELLFPQQPPRNGDTYGADTLTENHLLVVAYGVGETLDGIGAAAPRRADVSICRLKAAVTSTTAATDPQAAPLPMPAAPEPAQFEPIQN